LNEITWLGEGNNLGHDIWRKKYKYNNEDFGMWLDRITNGNKELRDSIENKEFIFAGRILANRGLHKLGRKITYSNCYVLTPPEDNLESIFDTAKNLARTFSYGGGCGIDISNLRPNGSKVNNSALETSGAVSFMDLYNLTTEVIGQNGRRGALMLSLSVDHPDIKEFIKIKEDLSKVQKANISVRMNDEFMKAVLENKEYTLSYNTEETGELIENKVNAKQLFKDLSYQNWNYAEPGMLFWNRISEWNLLSEDEEFEFAGTNPCAEEPLPAGGSCLLGSLILPSFIVDGVFDFEKLKKAVRVGVRALNEVLDEGLPLHPLQEQRDSVKDWRQIGLGILGVGDLLIKLGIRYGSEKSLEFSDKIAKVIINEALQESSRLAKELGAYPKFDLDTILKSKFLIANASDETIELIKENGLRNSQLLTIAPTGSIGTMLQMSTGIEPNFAFSYTRKTESLHGEDKFYEVFAPIAREYMDKHGVDSLADLPEEYITAQNLDPVERLKMQATWQNRIDASISSTVNLVHDTTIEEVENIYLKAWELGLKGVTVYRSGCAREGILTIDKKEEKNEVVLETPRGELKSIAEDTIYYPKNLRIGCGKLKVMIGFSPSLHELQDLYVIRSGSGGCEKNIQAVAIFMSGMLRLGGNLFMLEKSIEGISGCPSFASGNAKGGKLSKGNTCSSAILNVLKEFEIDMGLSDHEKAKILIKQKESKNLIKEEKKIKESVENKEDIVKCPECGDPLEVSGGCFSCRSCGYSKCD